MQIVPAGTIIPDMKKERFDEIQSVGNFLEELPEPTLKELREQAKELGIPGCNKMKKEELLEVLEGKGNRQGYGWRKSIQMIIVGKIRVQSQHSEVQSQHFRI